MNDKARNEDQHDEDVLDCIRSMFDLASGLPIQATLNLGPLAPKDGPSSISWCDPNLAQMFKVFVKYEDEDGGLSQHMGEKEAAALLKDGPLMVCVGIGFPPDVEPHADILHAAQFADAADVGDVAQHMKNNEVGRELCVSGDVAFEVGLFRFPAFWKRGEVMKFPLIVGMGHPQANKQ